MCAAALALLCLLAPGASASAAGLLQPRGKAGCVSQTGAEGCAKGRALAGVYTVVVTTDGRSAYASSFDSDAIATFDRDPRTGALRQKAGAAGCISLGGAEGCRKGRALDGARGIARSPDGRNVYVASPESNAIAIFDRDPRTGALSQKPGTAGCISVGGTEGCRAGRGLEFASAITISADGRTLYVAADESDAVTTFARNPRTGSLRQLPGEAGCISQTGTEGCAKGRGLDGVFFVAKSTDGKSVYAASFESNAVAIFARNQRTGALTQLPGSAGCISEDGSGGVCGQGRGLDGAVVLVATPDGRSAYAISSPLAESAPGSEAIAIFARDSRTGALRQKPGTGGCIAARGGEPGCAPGRALEGPAAGTVSPDGRNIYVGATDSNSVAAFDRNPRTGALTQPAGAAGCISQTGAEGCRRGRALEGVITLSPSPDGENLYAASIGSDAIAILDRR